jgi:hypothetical protein
LLVWLLIRHQATPTRSQSQAKRKGERWDHVMFVISDRGGYRRGVLESLDQGMGNVRMGPESPRLESDDGPRPPNRQEAGEGSGNRVDRVDREGGRGRERERAGEGQEASATAPASAPKSGASSPTKGEGSTSVSIHGSLIVGTPDKHHEHSVVTLQDVFNLISLHVDGSLHTSTESASWAKGLFRTGSWDGAKLSQARR